MLQVQNIYKQYPGTLALKDVSLTFENGVIHTLLGKNGAGKSTLVKIISGATTASGGKILVDGKETLLNSPSDAFRKGIATVYQELSLIPDLSIAENIFLGRLPKKAAKFIIDWKSLYYNADKALKEIGVNFDVKQKASSLSIGSQQVVEIAKAMSVKPSVLILDEPTSALDQHEVKSLFNLLRNLKSLGVAIIYITHRMQEIKEISDKISILRDGSLIGTLDSKVADSKTIVNMMFGELVIKEHTVNQKPSHDIVLSVKKMYKKNKLENINFDLSKGEILGLAGMLGSGRTELLRCIFGSDRFTSGEVIINNEMVKKFDPENLKKHGVAFITENRKEEGLIQILSTRFNLTLPNFASITKHGIISRTIEKKLIQEFIRNIDIKVNDPEQPVSSLSGGNQQKVIIAKWLNTKPEIILFDEPTRGIDIHTKQQIFRIIRDLSSKGISSIIVSTELEELVEVCTRILIMKKGTITGEVLPQNITADELFVSCMLN